ncbi:nucleic acid-binding protein (plasmid) [Streptomyces uncialis]|uniref:nucleic acid-binding protein n=1 Tax=Streptomyces uncialis TaxID=1048205 RepID=UPI002E30EBF8|nr:nucleic acid-binding protein [Streptomyces uncialis]
MATYDFPDDLVSAQHELDTVTAQLTALLETLPWAVEPMEAWERPKDYWYSASPSRPASPGWTDEQRDQVAALRARRLALATTVVSHPYWGTLTGGTVSDARTALKHLVQDVGEDVDEERRTV